MFFEVRRAPGRVVLIAHTAGMAVARHAGGNSSRNQPFPRPRAPPPVELYKIGDAYFVLDGHHRVSVARYHEVPTVEAAVAEFHPKLPAAPVLPMTSNSERAA